MARVDGTAPAPKRVPTSLRGVGARLRAWSLQRRVVAASCAAVLLAGMAVALVFLAGGGTSTPRSSAARASGGATGTAPRPPRGSPPAVCPLTGLAPPHGHVPSRPVLAVKVGNNPSARPQSGLEGADVVFDTLAEGGITRYIAVYQCGSAASVGPVRSVRWDDWHELSEFGRADLAFVGGVDPNRKTVASLPWICNLDAFVHPALYHLDPNRAPPDSTYSSTATLFAACPGSAAPPSPFRFARSVQAGSTPVRGVEVDYSPEADVVWQWSARDGAFLHAFRQGGAIVADVSAGGVRISARNVLIEVVHIQYGPYVETPGSTGDVESLTIGRGPAYLLRNGRLLRGQWVHTHWAYLTDFVTASGAPMLFSPGGTWVEIVPVGVPIVFTP